MLSRFIPPKYRYRLSDIKNSLIGHYAQTHYSQFGEDIVLTKLFSKKDGFYVDVGAHHPRRYSNTYLLHKRGWRGVNIDPNPYTVALFNKARPHDTNICAGVGSKSETREYYMFSDPAVNTFMESEAKQWMNKSWIAYLGTQSVPVMPLRDMLVSVADLPPIDVLSIDARGMDMEVLRSNDWKKCTPKVVVVESSTFDVRNPVANSVYAFLVLEHGYSMKAFAGSSLIFERA